MASNYFIPQRKNTGAAIASIGATIGKTITDLPGKVREKEKHDQQQKQLDIAYNAFQEDEGVLDQNYTAWKKAYKGRAEKQVELGNMTQQEMEANLSSIYMPTAGDKVDRKAFDAYLLRFSPAVAKLNQSLAEREKKGRVSGAVKGAMTPETQTKTAPGVADPETAQTIPVQGGPGQEQGAVTETDITSRPAGWETTREAPKTQQELMAQVGKTDPSITGKEVEATTAFETVPSQEAKEKAEAGKAKVIEDKRRWEAEYKLKKRRVAIMSGNMGEKDRNRFDTQTTKLTNAIDKKDNAVDDTMGLIDGNEELLGDLETERSEILAKIDKSPFLSPEEEQKMTARLEQIKTKNLGIKTKMVSLKEKLDKQTGEREELEVAYDEFILSKGGTSYAESLYKGKTGTEKPPPTKQPAPVQQPAPVKQPTPKIRTQQEKDQGAIIWARNKLKETPGDTVALRILKANGLAE